MYDPKKCNIENNLVLFKKYVTIIRRRIRIELQKLSKVLNRKEYFI